jgi:hypothetical protein
LKTKASHFDPENEKKRQNQAKKQVFLMWFWGILPEKKNFEKKCTRLNRRYVRKKKKKRGTWRRGQYISLYPQSKVHVYLYI